MKYDKQSINKRKQNNNITKKVIYIVLIILVYNIILVAISNVDKLDEINLFGYKAYIIKSDSMEPTIKNGDIIITKKVLEENIQVGDIITFMQNSDIITHRISKIEEEENGKKYITKGDNNNIEDSTRITYQEIKGKKIITIPYLGKIMNILESQIILLIILLILLIICFYKIERKEKNEIRRKKKKIEDAKKQQN